MSENVQTTELEKPESTEGERRWAAFRERFSILFASKTATVGLIIVVFGLLQRFLRLILRPIRPQNKTGSAESGSHSFSSIRYG